mgnify:FL=1
MDELLQITFLGTGTSQGIPIIGSNHPVCLSSNPKDKRLRVSVLISWKNYNYVIDCGPDFRQQMLNNPIDHLSGILFTHEHSDHTAGLDELRPFGFRQGEIPVFADKQVIAALHRRFGYIFDEKNRYPGVPDLQINEIIEGTPFKIVNKVAEPIKALHGGLEIFGFKIDNFVYLTDVKQMEDKEIEKIKGVDVLVVNALRITPSPSHFNLSEALAFVEKVKPQKTYFTHISHLLGFHAEVEKNLPKNVHLAYDNLVITV